MKNKKKEQNVVVFVEGGIVQTVLRPNARTKKGYTFVDYEIVDYDVFQNSDTDTAEMWDAFSSELKYYFKTRLKHEYRKFQKAVTGNA
jgi:hypothetical protein